MGRRQRIIGSVLHSRSLEEKSEIKQRFMVQFWDKLVAGTELLLLLLDSVYPIEEANAAQTRNEWRRI